MVAAVSKRFSPKLSVNKPAVNKLTVSNFTCEVGGRKLFAARSFTLSSGELLAIHGANGSGKSCFLRSLCGCVKPARTGVEGVEVFLNERRIALAELAPESMRVGHNAPFLASLSLFENLQFWSEILATDAASSRENLERASASFALSKFWLEPTWRLSAGQQQRGALASLALKPQASIWLLDEPHAALDAEARASLNHCLENHLNSGGMAIIASHEDLSALAQHRLTLC